MQPSPSSRDPFVRRMTARTNDLSVASMDVEEALVQVTQAAGLHYEVAVHNVAMGLGVEVEHTLRVFAILTTESEAGG